MDAARMRSAWRGWESRDVCFRASKTGRRLLVIFMSLLAALLVSPTLSLAQTGAAGSLRGAVVDMDFEVPLARARVQLLELNRVVRTGESGNFLFEDVPPGKYTLVVSKEGFEREVVRDIVVAPGQLRDVRVRLAQVVIELEELVVTGQDLLADTEFALLEIRAEAVTVQDSVSAELIKKAGVGDVAGALKLVVGASVVDGKYATVRGLSDRYTGTTLNGIRVPSADPRRRAVQLDIFPTGTIDSVTVTKTFTPDLQGDFTGGGVNIKTKSIPDGYTLNVSVSSEYDTEATFNDRFLTYEGGGVPTTGFAGSERDLPSSTSALLETVPLDQIEFRRTPGPEDIAAAAVYADVTGDFSPVMGISRDEQPLNSGLKVTYGNRFDFDSGSTIGVLTALSYSHKYNFFEGGENNTGAIQNTDGNITLRDARSDSVGNDEVLIGGLASLAYLPNEDHTFGLKLIANQSATDESRFQEEITIESPDGSFQADRNQSLVYTERGVLSAQLSGEHLFPGVLREGDIELDWVTAYNFTSQDQPDARFFRNTYLFDPNSTVSLGQGFMPLSGTGGLSTFSRRFFRTIEEESVVVAANASYNFLQWSGLDSKVKIGIYAEDGTREYDQNSFYYDFALQGGRGIERRDRALLSRFFTDDPDALWSDVFADPSRTGYASDLDSPNTPDHQLLWVIAPLPDVDTTYTGDQEIQAVYAMTELSLTEKLTLVAGARLEKTTISVRPDGAESIGNTVEIIERQPSGARGVVEVPEDSPLAIADIDESNLLPSVGLVYDLAPAMKLRGSWSRTIARPTYRELAPIATQEFLEGDEFVGNPGLELSEITNYDLRWEWFQRPGEVLAFSLFYKDIQKPIEYISFGAGGRTFINPFNFDQGTIQGFEIEAKSSLDVIWERLGGFTVSANYSLLDSEVDVLQEELELLRQFGIGEETRRLLGQPEFIANLAITYDNDDWGTSAGLFYNYVGEVLKSGAAQGDTEVGANPDVFESSIANLDFNVSQRITSIFSISLKGKNLLEDDRRTYYYSPASGIPVSEATKTLRTTSRVFSFSASWKW